MIVVDNSSLSALARISQLRILSFLFDDVIVPKSVMNEFEKEWAPQILISFVTILEEVLPIDKKIANDTILSEADKQCLTIAENQNIGMITDDLRLRKYCEQLGRPVNGTIGLMKMAYVRNFFQDFEEYKLQIYQLADDLFLSEDLINFALDV